MPGKTTGVGLELNFDDDTDVVQFGGHRIAFAGVISGVIIAVTIPTVTLIFGKDLGAGWQIMLSLVALISGGVIAGVSAFFGTVMPSHVTSKGGSSKRAKTAEAASDSTEYEVEGNQREMSQD